MATIVMTYQVQDGLDAKQLQLLFQELSEQKYLCVDNRAGRQILHIQHVVRAIYEDDRTVYTVKFPKPQPPTH